MTAAIGAAHREAGHANPCESEGVRRTLRGIRREMGCAPRQVAGLTGRYSGHSARVGMAQDLARAGTELPALMQAGRWNSPAMPARYTANEQAGRGAVARYYEGRRAG